MKVLNLQIHDIKHPLNHNEEKKNYYQYSIYFKYT